MRARLGAFELVEPVAVAPGLADGVESVWRGIHPATRVRVTVHIARDDSRSAQHALLHRLCAASRLKHPGLMMPLGVGCVPEGLPDFPAGRPWWATERASGGTLAEVESLSWSALRAVLLGVLDVLAHAHAREVFHGHLGTDRLQRCFARDARPGLKVDGFGWVAAEDALVDLVGVGAIAQELAPEAVPDGFQTWCGRLLCGIRGAAFPSPAAAASALLAMGDPEGEVLPADRSFAYRNGPGDGHPLEVPRVTLAAGEGAMAAAGEVPAWRGCALPRVPDALRLASMGLAGARSVRMVGHENERDVLWSALRGTLESGGARYVVVHGTDGLIRSHIATWFGARVAELGLCGVVHAHFRRGEPADREIARMVARRLGLDGLDHADMVDEITHAGPVPGRDPEELAGILEGTELVQLADPVWVSWLQRIADGPLMLCLHDTDARPEVSELVRSVLVRSRVPVVVLETRSVPPDPSEPFDEVVALGPLPVRDLATQVRDLLPLERELLESLCARADGHAGLALETVRTWAEGEQLRWTPRGLRPASGSEQLPVPEDFHTVVDRRLESLLEGLPEEDGVWLERHAVSGTPWEIEDASVSAELLVRLATRGWVWGRGRVDLHTGWMRDALERRARRLGRLAGHHRAAGGVEGATAGTRAMHLDAAGLHSRALKEWLTGVDESLEACRPLLAHRCLDELDARLAAADPRRHQVVTRRAHAIWLSGDLDGALQLSSPLLGRLSSEARVLLPVAVLVHAWILAELGHPDRAAQVLTDQGVPDAARRIAVMRFVVGDPLDLAPSPADEDEPVVSAARVVAGSTDLRRIRRALAAVRDRRLRAALWARAATHLEPRAAEIALENAIALEDAIHPRRAARTRLRLAVRLVQRREWKSLVEVVTLALMGLDPATRETLLPGSLGLVASAIEADWVNFDRGLRNVAGGLAGVDDPLVAACLEHAAEFAHAADHGARAANAWRLARGTWRVLGDRQGEERVDARIREIYTTR